MNGRERDCTAWSTAYAERMKRSTFAIVSLVAAIIVAIPVVLIVIIDGLGLGESHPLVVVAFPVILILSLAEAPIQALNVPINAPVVLPLVSLLAAVASIVRKEPRVRLAYASIGIVIVSISALFLL